MSEQSNYTVNLSRQKYLLEKELITEYLKTEFVPGGMAFREDPIIFENNSSFKNSSFNTLFSQFAISKPVNAKNVNLKKNEIAALTSIKKILQRGDPSYLSPKIEKELLKKFKFVINTEKTKGDISPKIVSQKFTIGSTEQDLTNEIGIEHTSKIKHDTNLKIFDSEAERKFFLLCEEAFPNSLKWLHPQIVRRHLVKSDYVEQEVTENRRGVDFLYSPPWQKSIVIEVLGPHWFDQNEDNTDASTSIKFQQYKERFNDALVDVYGIPVNQINNNSGKDLERVMKLLTPPEKVMQKEIPKLLNTLWGVGALQHLFVELFNLEKLHSKKHWKIKLNSSTFLIGFNYFLDFLHALFKIWNTSDSFPKKITFKIEDNNKFYFEYQKNESGKFKLLKQEITSNINEHVNLKIESDKTYLEKYVDANSFYVRKSNLPFRHETTINKVENQKININPQNQTDLEQVLQYVFAKEKFRNIQFEAIRRVLAKKSSLVLLPTGFGKSMIYQLASLILPGVTLVISPTVALIKNQQKNLEINNISRAIGISGEDTPLLRELKYNSISNGDIYLILCSPERLLSPQFTDKLKNAVSNIGLSLNAIDEAHCISEWGQEFRTSYLGIGKRLNSLSQKTPPLLALTGTASLKVRQDITFNCELSEDDVLQADDFKREELHFKVIMNDNPKKRNDEIKNYFENDLKQFFSINMEEFFKTKEDMEDNNLIVVFVPYKKDTITYQKILKKYFRDIDIDVDIGIMWGTKPFLSTDWNNFIGTTKNNDRVPRLTQMQYKDETTEKFRTGKLKIIIATKAFGMGIDIPNIRSVLHIGVPSSLMSWYQEAGRAGRDKNNSLCTTIFTEEENINPEELFREHNIEVVEGIEKKLRSSDIWTHLQFYYNSFPGIYEEVLYLVDFLRKLNEEYDYDIYKENRSFSLPFFGESLKLDQDFESILSPEKEREIEELERESETINNFIDKTIYRLLICGVLKNWHKDFSTQQYELEFNSINQILNFHELENWLKQRLHTTTDGFIENIRLIASKLLEYELSYTEVIDEFITLLELEESKEITKEEQFNIKDLKNLDKILITPPSLATDIQRNKLRKTIEYRGLTEEQLEYLDDLISSNDFTQELHKKLTQFFSSSSFQRFSRESLTRSVTTNQLEAINNILNNRNNQNLRNEFRNFVPKNKNQVDWFFLKKLIYDQFSNDRYKNLSAIQNEVPKFQKKASGFDAFIICIFTYLVIATYESIGYQKRASHLDVYKYSKQFNNNEEIQNFFNSFFGDSDDVFASKLRTELINPLKKDEITLDDWIDSLQKTPNIESVVFDIEKGRDTADQFSLWWVGYLYVFQKTNRTLKEIVVHLDEYASLHDDAVQNIYLFLEKYTDIKKDVSFISAILNWVNKNPQKLDLDVLSEFNGKVMNFILENKIYDDSTLTLLNNSIIDKLNILKTKSGLVRNKSEY